MDTSHWIKQIDKTTASFKESFNELSEAELNWKHDAKTWSVAQNIHHLMVINKTYYPVIKSVREGTYQLPWISKINFIVNFFGNTILKSVSPSRKRKMKTFPFWEPSHSNISSNIVREFEEHQSQLKDLIESSRDLLESGTIISSPANKNIVYTLKCAFDIIVTHEQRHYNQAIEANELRLKSTRK